MPLWKRVEIPNDPKELSFQIKRKYRAGYDLIRIVEITNDKIILEFLRRRKSRGYVREK